MLDTIRTPRLVAASLVVLSLATATLFVPLSQAQAEEAAGAVTAIDLETGTITLDDGSVFVLGPDLDPEGLEVGNEVLLTYDEGDNGTLIVSMIEITE